MTTENTPEVADATEIPTPAQAFAEETTPSADKLAEAVQKARAQEKAKLYPQLEKTQEELAAVKKILEEQKVAEAARTARRQEREAARAQEKKALEEDEMSFKELLQTKEKEFAAQLEAERSEREKAFALLQREREFQELQQYRSARIEQERDAIVPELIDLVSGNTQDEVEASIADLKARTAKLLESVAAVSQNARKDMVGARVTVPANGPLDTDSDSFTLSPNDISNMSMADYAKNRTKLLSNSNNRGQGLFG